MSNGSITAVLPGPPARRPVLLLALGSFALGTDVYVISGVLPAVASGLHVGTAAAGLLVTVFSAVYALGAPILAVVSGGIERRRLLTTALAVFVAANVVATLAPDYGTMAAARVLAALGAGLYTPAATAVAAGLAAPHERGRALAAVLGGLTLAGALGVPAGTLVGQNLGWRWTFVLVTVLGLVALIGLATSLPPIPAGGTASLRERLAVAAIRGVPATLTSIVLALAGVYTLYTYLAWFAGHTAGIRGGALAAVYFGYGVAALIATAAAGWLTDHRSPSAVAAFSIGGLVVAYGALGLLAWRTRPSAGVAVALAALVVFWALTGWMFYPAQQKRLVAVAGLPQAPVVLSLSASAVYAGQAVGGAAGGALLGGNPGRLGAAAAVAEALALVALAVAVRQGRAPRPKDPAPVHAPTDTPEEVETT
ncbi:MFS transporter [Actinacidiphila acididurans]|uniref:MFS transporter n=1 Tax=Actinacidiphila acididurans TaxID=2784346 RepID=A0ABS2TVU5_9ACTN|nr:MFS transporter [Actinacidiphila acididurans]MBM9507465.1 MFS transporter [Actinacidiphila acididurans]